MSVSIDELYFDWLVKQVCSVGGEKFNSTLLEWLFLKEFLWSVHNDDNRVADGVDLRHEFLEDQDLEADYEWTHIACSFLEMLIGLSRRLSFMTGWELSASFWVLMENLELISMDNAHFSSSEVDHILDRVIYRTYEPDGRGGLFPLSDPGEDQRNVEIWYQMNAWVSEQMS
jgi:hypothetical protein